jgi:hypothetical protein
VHAVKPRAKGTAPKFTLQQIEHFLELADVALGNKKPEPLYRPVKRAVRVEPAR